MFPRRYGRRNSMNPVGHTHGHHTLSHYYYIIMMVVVVVVVCVWCMGWFVGVDAYTWMRVCLWCSPFVFVACVGGLWGKPSAY